MTSQGAIPHATMEDVDTLPIRNDSDEWEWNIQRAHQTHQLNSIALETTRELPAVPETGERRRTVRTVSSWSFQALDRLANDLKEISIYRSRT
jgi:hypothetical protein